MATVTLDFIPPYDPDIVALHIYEASAKDGPFSEIERATAVGTYPNYITRYVSTLAINSADWFTIAWENAAGEISPTSSAVQGGTSTLVGIIVQRMLLRDSSLDEAIAAQEAEAAISDYFVVVDTSTIDPTTVSPKVLSGLTNLALARTYITKQITSSATGRWTAGIVSMDNSSANSAKSAETIKALIDLANRDLGRNFSVVLLLKEVTVAGGMKQLQGVDLSRLLLEVQ
jgi:hypothetical protein